MNEIEENLLIKKLDKKSKLKKLSDEDVFNLLDIYYTDTKEPIIRKSFAVEPFYLGIKFYEEKYPEFYNKIVKASEMGRLIISEGENKSCTNRLTRRILINLRGNNRDAFTVVHEFAHYIDLENEDKYVPKCKGNLYSETFAFYMENQFEKYLLSKGFYVPVEDNRLRRKSVLSWYASVLNDYLWLSNIYKNTGRIPNYEQERVKNILYIGSNDLKLYITRYLLGDVISDSLRGTNITYLKDDIKHLSLSNEIEKRLK